MRKKQKCEFCSDADCDCEKDIRVYICPNCKSCNVRYVFEFGNLFGIIPKMKCSDCGFSASGFPVLITNKRKIAKAKEKLKKEKRKKRVVKKSGRKR